MTDRATGLVVWKEPRKASLLFVTRIVDWAPLRFLLFAFAAIAFVHALLAIANLARNRGVLLRLRSDGELEWPRSIQEVVLRRSADRVGGPVVRVKVEADHPGISQADPRVTLLGAERKIGFLPLHGTSVEDFITHVNSVLAVHSIRLERVSDDVQLPENSADSEPADSDPDADN